MFSLKVDDEIELRLPQESYAEEAFAVVKANYQHLNQWTNWVNEKTSVETSREFYKTCVESFQSGGPVLGLVIFYQGRIVGGTGFHEINRVDRSAETGYWLAKDCSGRGIVTKSVKRLIDFAFEELGINRIVIKCAPDNLKSRAIPEKLGFTQEGIERDGGWLHQKFVDHVVYSMLAREWCEKDQAENNNLRIRVDEEIELRPYLEKDADELLTAVMANYEHLHPFLHWVKPDYSLAGAKQFITQSQKEIAEKKRLGFGLFYQQKLVGSIGFVNFSWDSKRAEIGYWIAKDRSGRGIITRSCQALINYAFDKLEMNRVEIRCATENVRSRAIPERLGFQLEGVLRQEQWRHTRLYDIAIYGLLKDEWKGK